MRDSARPSGRRCTDPGTLERDEIAQQSQRSDHAVAELVPITDPGCSAAVAVDGEVLWAGAGGLADLTAKNARHDR